MRRSIAPTQMTSLRRLYPCKVLSSIAYRSLMDSRHWQSDVPTDAVWWTQASLCGFDKLSRHQDNAIDRVPERLQMAKDGKAEVLNYEEVEVGEALKEMTGGRGPDSVMDAVGMEAHGLGLEGFYDKVKQTARLETDRPNVLRQAIVACRKGGTVSVTGVYTGFVDKMPMGAFMNKGLTMKTGQTHVHRYLHRLLDRVQNGDIDLSFAIAHRLPLEQAPHGYEIFKHKKDNCIKIMLKP